jgi:hypothetical protein
MTKKIKLRAVLLPIGIVCVLVIFLLSTYKCTNYKKPSPCARVRSDARTIAAAISNYFADPSHTDVRPSDLSTELKFIENPWTFTQCGDEIIIVVFDREMKCPVQGQYDEFEWNSHLLILRL